MKKFTRDLSLSWPANGKTPSAKAHVNILSFHGGATPPGERGEQRRHYCCHDHRSCEGLAYARGGRPRRVKNGRDALEMGRLFFIPESRHRSATVERSSLTSTSPPRCIALMKKFLSGWRSVKRSVVPNVVRHRLSDRRLQELVETLCAAVFAFHG
jgi:hypothetical protein